MALYIVRRILAAVPTLLIAFTVCFLIVHATPGSPWSSDRPVAPEVEQNLDAKYHLSDPIVTQYVTYLWNALHGDFGPSYSERTLTVVDIIRAYLPTSISIGACAMAFALVLGLLLGGLAAVYRGSWIDSAITTLAT